MKEKDLAAPAGNRPDSGSPCFRSELEASTGHRFYGGTGIRVLEDGDEIFPAMLDAIAEARNVIRLQTYVYWQGEIAERFANALAEKARSGVSCHVLLDAFGSQRMRQEWVDMMTESGVEVSRYNPFRWSRFFAYQHRTHRKILICDGEVGFIGGVGIAEEWTGHAQDPDHWHDFHFRIDGPIVADLVAAFDDNWTSSWTVPPNIAAPRQCSHEKPTKREDTAFDALVLQSSPQQKQSCAFSTYELLFNSAKKSIKITTAYFIPDDEIMEMFRETATRGVDIEIITPGSQNDSALAHTRSRSFWTDLLEAGISLHIYEETMCHAKTVIIDDQLVSIGSINFDELSLRLNDETNLIVDSREFAAEMTAHFEKDRARSRTISLEEHRSRSVFQKMVEPLVNLFVLPWWKDSANY